MEQLDAGFLPYDIFIQVARLCVLSIVELVIFKMVDGHVNVLLLERDSSDPVWPGMLHSPGTVVRPTDEDMPNSQLSRVVKDELGGIEISKPNFLMDGFHETERGKENAAFYWAELLGAAKNGQLYPVNRLPDNVIKYQRPYIAAAAKAFSLFSGSPR